MIKYKSSIILSVLFVLYGCGGGDSGGGSGVETPAVKTGQFRDAAVSGASYQIGSEIKVTGSHGQFSYRDNDDIKLSIGSLKLGKTKAKPVITPLDLTAVTDPTSDENINMVRVLMGLDADGDAENGIQISQELVDYLTSELDLSQIDLGKNDISEITAGFSYQDESGNIKTLTLPSKDDAKGHLEETLRCNLGGIYTGELNVDGEDNSELGFGLVINPLSMVLNGFVVDTADDAQLGEYLHLVGDRPLELTGGENSIVLSINDREFSGDMTANAKIFDGEISGDWTVSVENESGTFLLEKNFEWEVKGKRKFVGTITRNPEINNRPTAIIQLVEYADNHLRVHFYDFTSGTETTTEARINEDGTYNVLVDNPGDYTDDITFSLPVNGNVLQENNLRGSNTDAAYNIELSSCRL